MEVHYMTETINHFISIFNKELKNGNKGVIEILLLLSTAHFFGIFNPKQLADYMEIEYRYLYREIKKLSLYKVQNLLLKLMVNELAPRLKETLNKSASTVSRASICFSVDNSVINRYGKMIRCTWRWYSGNCKKIVNGQDLMGIVININGFVFPISLKYCSKQGRANTTKPTLLISMFTLLKNEFERFDIDITNIPITMDSWFASSDLKDKLHELGFTKVIVAGKGSYVFKIGEKSKSSLNWKKSIDYKDDQWGIDVKSARCKGQSKTFGNVVLFFFKHSRSRNYYLINFSKKDLRAAEIWHIWKKHHVIENFWKQLKSVFKIKEIRLHGDGLYTGLLIKVLAYMMVILLKQNKAYSKLSLSKIMKQIFMNNDLKQLAQSHFHSVKFINTKPLVN